MRITLRNASSSLKGAYQLYILHPCPQMDETSSSVLQKKAHPLVSPLTTHSAWQVRTEWSSCPASSIGRFFSRSTCRSGTVLPLSQKADGRVGRRHGGLLVSLDMSHRYQLNGDCYSAKTHDTWTFFRLVVAKAGLLYPLLLICCDDFCRKSSHNYHGLHEPISRSTISPTQRVGEDV